MHTNLQDSYKFDFLLFIGFWILLNKLYLRKAILLQQVLSMSRVSLCRFKLFNAVNFVIHFPNYYSQTDNFKISS